MQPESSQKEHTFAKQEYTNQSIQMLQPNRTFRETNTKPLVRLSFLTDSVGINYHFVSSLLELFSQYPYHLVIMKLKFWYQNVCFPHSFPPFISYLLDSKLAGTHRSHEHRKRKARLISGLYHH